MINWPKGKEIRIKRFIDEDTGAILAIPMDHGYSIGKAKGLIDLNSTVEKVFAGGASCVIVQRGMARSIDVPKQNGLLIHVSGSTGMSSRPNYKILTGSVIDTIRTGADGISCHVNIGPDEDAIMLQDLSALSEEADMYNLPLLAMMYTRSNEGIDDKSIDALSHTARIAEEAGVDIVKINTPDNPSKFDEVVQGINIPVIVAGGSKTGDFNQFLENIKTCILNGASGISIGRNIFQADNQKMAMAKVKDVVVEAINEVGKIEILP